MGIEPRFYKIEKDGPIIIWKFTNPPKNMATMETSRERELFFECLRSEDAINIMRLYVGGGQDREKMIALIEETGGDPEKLPRRLQRKPPEEMNDDTRTSIGVLYGSHRI